MRAVSAPGWAGGADEAAAGGLTAGVLAGGVLAVDLVAGDWAEQPVSVITVMAAAAGMASRAGPAARRAMPDDVARMFMT